MRRIVSERLYYLFVTIMVVLFFFVLTDVPGSVKIGYATHPTYPEFAKAKEAFFLNYDAMHFNAGDQTKSLFIRTKDEVVYRKGYLSINGGGWHEFSFEGERTQGDWFFGPVTYELKLERSLVPEENTGHYVLVYSCEAIKNQDYVLGWNCQEDKWQLLSFNTTKELSPEELAGEDS